MFYFEKITLKSNVFFLIFNKVLKFDKEQNLLFSTISKVGGNLKI